MSEWLLAQGDPPSKQMVARDTGTLLATLDWDPARHQWRCDCQQAGCLHLRFLELAQVEPPRAPGQVAPGVPAEHLARGEAFDPFTGGSDAR